jgi:protein-S-isoprenylcysteine O-methyltransferase Ste14
MAETPFPKLLMWSTLMTVVGCLILGLSGRWTDPWLWAYLVVLAGSTLYAMLNIGQDVARERFRPPTPGADEIWLRAIRIVAVAHIIVAALDVGRWHLTSVPEPLRIVGLAGMAIAFLLLFRAMVVNRYFSAVVRVQRERGHRVVDCGPYAHIRHPGYLGMIAGVPLGALVLGSWLGFAIALVYSALIVRRVLFEDLFLRTNLEGYATYTQRVRYRLVPGLW